MTGPAFTMSAIGQLMTAGTVSERATSNKMGGVCAPDGDDAGCIPQQRRDVLQGVLGHDDVPRLHMPGLFGAVQPHQATCADAAHAGLTFVNFALESQNARQNGFPTANSLSAFVGSVAVR